MEDSCSREREALSNTSINPSIAILSFMRVLILFFSFFLLFFSSSIFAENSLRDYLDTAVIFKESGEYERAIDILKTAKNFSKNPQILKYQAKLEFLSGHSSKALNFFNKIENKDWQNFIYLGLIYEDLGKKTLAITNYLKALTLRENVVAYFRLGKIYRKKGDLKLAIKYFSSIIEFDPSIRLAYYYLGECFYQNTDYKKAYKFLAKAIKFYPGVALIGEKLETVKQELGEDFFKSRKKAKEEKRKKVKLIAYVQEKDIPLVRVGLNRGAKEFSFSSSSNFLISNNEDSYSGLADKLYTFALEGEKLVLRDYQDRKEYKTFSKIVSITSLVQSKEKSPFYILNISSGVGDFWPKERDKAYRGDLEIIVGDDGITLINILSVEEYLYGVLSAEMPSKSHSQALMAQAVAARTFAFRNLGRHKRQEFNFCPHVHCQVYQGISAEVSSTIAAVNDTRGEVVVYNDKPIDILFHANCGGCLASDVFGQSNYLEEKVDNFDLSLPDSAYGEEEWFLDLPLVFCSEPKGSKHRWQRVYDREDFSIAFGEKLEDLGNIILKEKGDCFHYKEIEIITLADSKNLKGDLTIRNYFDHLRSSAFKLEKKLTDKGQTSMLLFWGAGFGHGTGMCQDGAISMAEDGYNWRQIIEHYFSPVKIKKLY